MNFSKTVQSVLALAGLAAAAAEWSLWARVEGCPTVVFGEPHRMPTLGGVFSTVLGDFNGDGRMDVAMPVGQWVILALGNGDGSLQSPTQVFTSPTETFSAPDYYISRLKAVDFNGDGRMDLVTRGDDYSGSFGTSTNYLLLGNGDGTFVASRLPVPPDLVADFNNDGQLDLLSMNNWWKGSNTTVQVSLNKGNGTFEPSSSAPMELPNVSSIVSADFDGDGFADLAAVSYGTAIILRNDGHGAFPSRSTNDLGTVYTFGPVLAGDFNGDGKADLLVGVQRPQGSVILLLPGKGNGDFGAPIETRLSQLPGWGTAVDVNHDGKLDLVAGVAVFLGNGDGTFQPGATVASVAPQVLLQSMAVGDINGDGAPDIVFTESDKMVTVLFNGCSVHPMILVQPVSQLVQEGEDASFSVTATAELALSYQWQRSGTNLVGQTEPTLVLRQVQASDSGIYTVLVSTTSGSVNSAEAVLQVSPKNNGVTLISRPDAVELQRALNSGGQIQLGFNGSLTLTQTLLAKFDATVDATGYAVTLDASNRVRHFVVTNGATLRLVNLTLQNGRFMGEQGQANQAGKPGWGGSIYNAAGTLELNSCRFINNAAVGGDGGAAISIPPFPAPAPSTKGGSAYGGAIYSSNGTLRASNCWFAGNGATGGRGQGDYTFPAHPGFAYGGIALGGALFSSDIYVTLSGCTFTNNLAVGVGDLEGTGSGGAFAGGASTTVVTNCVFVANRATATAGSGGANGGAFYHSGGAVSVSRSFFLSNSVTGGRGGTRITSSDGNGAGLCLQSGRLELRDSTVAFNTAQGGNSFAFPGSLGAYPGGVGQGGGIFNQGTLTVVNCTMVGNTAAGGIGEGGASIQSGNAYGGGLFNSGGDVSLLNVTVASNNVASLPTTTLNGSLYGAGTVLGASIFTTNATVRLTNSILAVAPEQTNVSGILLDGGHNLASDNSASFTGPGSLNHLDPRLGPLANNGGPTPTMALLPGSPAIDAGDTAVAPAVDQRGIPRPFGLASDIGAFEFTPTLTISRAASSSVHIEYHYQPLTACVLSASTNLIDWFSLETATSDTNGVSRFTDAIKPQEPKGFYRVEQLPQLRVKIQ